MTLCRTAMGKEYPCDFMGVAPGLATMFVTLEIDLVEALTVFQNPEETNTLEWLGDDGSVVREETGYTKFGGFTILDGDCPVRIRLQKPDTI